MRKESLSSSMPKLILAVVLIVCIGAVMGLMGWALTKKQMGVEAPEIEVPDKIIEDKTVDWQTYRNEEFGFEFKYPSKKLKINSQDSSKDLRSLLFFPVDENESFEHSLNLGSLIYCNNNTPKHSHFTQHKNFQEYRESIISMGNLKDHNLFKSNNLEWFCYTPLTTKNIEYDTKTCITEKSKNLFYQISFSFERTGNKYFNTDEFDKLVRSFKSIDQFDTSGWQIYRNEEFGFEVKYPRNWKAIENGENGGVLFFDNPFYANEYKLSEGPEFEDKYRDYAFISIGRYSEGTRTAAGTITKDTEIKDFVYKLYRKDRFVSEETIIGGQKAYMFGYMPIVYLKQKNDIVTISMWSGPEHTDHKKLAATFRQILSTFKFIEK